MVESLSDKQGKKVYVALSLYRLWLKEPQYVLYHHLYHNSHHLLYITTCKPTTSSKQLKLNRCHCLCYNINILYSHSQHPHCHWPKLNLYQNSHYLWYHNQHYTRCHAHHHQHVLSNFVIFFISTICLLLPFFYNISSVMHNAHYAQSSMHYISTFLPHNQSSLFFLRLFNEPSSILRPLGDRGTVHCKHSRRINT